jgi:hypothetical protein
MASKAKQTGLQPCTENQLGGRDNSPTEPAKSAKADIFKVPKSESCHSGNDLSANHLQRGDGIQMHVCAEMSSQARLVLQLFAYQGIENPSA